MSEQLQKKHTAIYGEELGREYHEVYNQWCMALRRQKEIGELFGDRERVRLLNKVAPSFFYDVQQLFWQDLVLYVTRLTDKDSRAIGIRSLERHLVSDLKEEVKAYRNNAEESVEPFRKWRNKVIAHADRKRAIHGWPSTMEGVNLTACRHVLNQVHAILNVISLRRGNGSSLANDVFYDPISESLVAHLDGLVNGVRFIASIIDPEHPDGTPKRCRDFLDKLGRRGCDDYGALLDFLFMAQRFS